jgi:hypothetical protein
VGGGGGVKRGVRKMNDRDVVPVVPLVPALLRKAVEASGTFNSLMQIPPMLAVLAGASHASAATALFVSEMRVTVRAYAASKYRFLTLLTSQYFARI